MFFPRYWTKASVRGPNRDGEETSITAWGWSDVSEDDARRLGTVRAQKLLERWPDFGAKVGVAYYQDRPFREPILEELSRLPVRALVTRNSLGCDVLNADCLAFADIDESFRPLSFWERLVDFGGKKAGSLKREWELKVRESLKSWQSANPSWSFRVYRTAGGFRLLVTSKLLQAGAEETELWLEAVGADPLYRKLCRNQKTFRARLTPKPWRCGARQPPMRSPWDSPEKLPAMEKWLKDYQKRSEKFAVCEFLETVGNSQAISSLKPFIDAHDARTAASSGRPLA